MLGRSVISSVSYLFRNRNKVVLTRCQPFFLSANSKKDYKPPSITYYIDGDDDEDEWEVEARPEQLRATVGLFDTLMNAKEKHKGIPMKYLEVIDDGDPVSSLAAIRRLQQDEPKSSNPNDSKETPNALHDDITGATPSPVTLHEQLLKVLKPHQIDGIQFMYDRVIGSLQSFRDGYHGEGCILAHDPSLGKTLQVIVLVHTIFSHPWLSTRVKKVLILAPKNVTHHWDREFRKWLDYSKKPSGVILLESSDRNRISLLRTWYDSPNPSVMIMSYEMYRNLVFEDGAIHSNRLRYPGPNMIICDEAHKLKNNKSALVQSVLRVFTKRRICITSTPIRNDLDDYFALFNFVKPGLLGKNRWHFAQKFTDPIMRGSTRDATEDDVNRSKLLCCELDEICNKYVHRRSSSILKDEIPPRTDTAIMVRLNSTQIEMYKAVLQTLDRPIGTKCSLSEYSILSRIAVHPFDIFFDLVKEDSSNSNEHPLNAVLENWSFSNKLVVLMEIIKGCEKVGDKLLVFSNKLKTIALIRRMLRQQDETNQWFTNGHEAAGADENWGWKEGEDFLVIDGYVSEKKREAMRDQFNDPANRRTRLMLISTTACSASNMVAANRVVLFDVSWNPYDDAQAVSQVFCIGQTKPTFVYRLIAQGTVEEQIYNRQIAKNSISMRVLDKHQLERRFAAEELNDLYRFDPKPYVEGDERKMEPPKNRLLADVIQSHPEAIVSYKNHDDYCENQVDEQLSEKECEAAWRDLDVGDKKTSSD